MEERYRRSGSGGWAVDGLWTGGSRRNSMGEEGRDGGARLKVRIWWTGGGRAGGAKIAWEEARDGGARLKVRIRWTGGGRAGAAEIAWEEARDGGAISKVRIRWTGGGRAVDGRELQK